MQTTTGLPVSFNYSWGQTSNAWELEDTSMYQYNTAGKVVEELVLRATGMERVQNSYDAQGRIVQENYAYFLPGTGWVSSYEAQYAFDSDGRRTLFLEITFQNGAVLDTVYGERIEVQLDPVFAKPSVEYHFVLGAAGWDTTLRREYSYNANASLTRVREFMVAQNGWSLHGEIRYGWRNGIIDTVNIAVKNSTLFLTDVLRYVGITYHQWNGTFETSKPQRYTVLVNFGQGLFITSRSTFTYDALGGYVQVDSAFDFSAFPLAWRPSDRFTYEIDAQGNFRGEKHEIWSNTWQIETHERYTFLYTSSNQVDEYFYSEYDNASNTYRNEWRRDYTMQLVSGIGSDVQTKIGEVSIFPNPVSASTAQLAIQLSQEEKLTITLHDGLGRQMHTLKDGDLMTAGSHMLLLPVEQLSAGTYWVRVQSKHDLRTVRLSVQ
jgi:hypothetical protein